MIDDCQSAKTYFDEVAALATRLARAGISIYGHRFNYLAFGSWEIVAGRRDRMLRFTYDGKDSYLSYCDAAVKPKSHLDLQRRRFATDKGERPFDFLAEVLEKDLPK